MASYNNSVNNVFKNQPVHQVAATTYVATLADSIIESTDNSAAVTITLPTAGAINTGKMYYIKDQAGTAGTANPISIAPATGTIDGAASQTINTNYGWIVVYSDGSNWYIIASYSSSFFTWSAVSGTTQAALPNYGYYCTNAALTTVTLPASIAAGLTVAVASTPTNTAGWKIDYGTGQSIVFGNQTSTTTSGSLTSSSVGDVVYLLCIVADTTFLVTDSVGNIAIA